MGHLNKRGATYSYTAIAGERADYDVLPTEAADYLTAVKKRIAEDWSKPEKRRLASDMAGCLTRLSGFFLQAKRMREHGDQLRRVVGEPDSAVAIRGDEACYDFESMLFQARGAMDRLTLMISRQYGQNAHSSRSLKNILERTAPTRDERARRARAIVGECKALEAIVIDMGGNKISLRSSVAHRTGILEESENAFTIHFLKSGGTVRFDYRALGHPVLATAQVLTEEVPFAVMNVVAAYLDVNKLKLEAFASTWRNPTIVFEDHLDSACRGPEFSLIRLTPNGFEIVKTARLVPNVLELAAQS